MWKTVERPYWGVSSDQKRTLALSGTAGAHMSPQTPAGHKMDMPRVLTLAGSLGFRLVHHPQLEQNLG